MALSDFDRELIAATQSGLPLVARPYEAVGAMLARMHLAGQDFAMQQPNLRGLAWWAETVPVVAPFLAHEQRTLIEAELAARAAERSEYFRGELEQFLSLQHRSGGDPLQPLGSYAGAMGLPQFMPSSHVKWAVDFDGDGRIDLSNSAADAIGSVASYFKGYGWQTGMPTHYPVAFDSARLDKEALLAPDILPSFSVASFTAKGAVLEGQALQHNGPLALVELQMGEAAPRYVAGTENFYVITRYNWSSYYAMAVIELGREVQQAMQRGGP